MKLFSSLQEVWGSLHLSTALFSPSPTHIHIHTQSIFLSLYTYILKVFLIGLFLLGIAYLSLLHTKLSFMEGLSWTKWNIRSLKTFLLKSCQIFQALCLSYRLRNEVHTVSNSNLTQPQSWFFFMMLYCLSMDSERDHIVIKSVHN